MLSGVQLKSGYGPKQSSVRWAVILCSILVIIFSLIVSAEAAAQAKIDIHYDPATDSVSLIIPTSGDPGEIFEVYSRGLPSDRDCPISNTWKVAESYVSSHGEENAVWTDVNLDSGRIYAIGRADIDLDENGIPDARQQLMSVFDLPSEDRARWASAGLTPLPAGVQSVADIKDFGAVGDGVADDTSALKNAIKSINSGVVYVPPGRYRITGRIYLKSNIILRGAGHTETRLLFEGSGTYDRCIGITRWNSEQTHPFIDVVNDPAQGATIIQVTDAGGFSVGDVIEIEQDNEQEWDLTDSWQQRLVGQISHVVAIDTQDHKLYIERPLRLPYSQDRNARVRKLETIENAGIEDLYIERKDAVEGYTIEMKYAVNCWVKGVESYNTYRAHVWIESSSECEVRESYMHHSHVYGGGGQGYGVACTRHTSDCLVEDNIFHDLRHSMIVGVGANGNVYGYNYSFNRGTDPEHGTLQPDISVHGNYVYMNLFEGNVVEDADLPDYYHPAGPGNTLYRNRILNWGEAVEISSDRQNVIGNEMPSGCITVESGVEGAICHGNSESGEIQWDASMCQNVAPSFYRSCRPAFFPENDPEIAWPPIGPGTSATTMYIPAQKRYLSGNYIP